MNPRVLKVLGVSTYTNTRGQFVDLPSIKLQGRWLENMGFPIGSRVEIKGRQGILLIKLIKEN